MSRRRARILLLEDGPAIHDQPPCTDNEVNVEKVRSPGDRCQGQEGQPVTPRSDQGKALEGVRSTKARAGQHEHAAHVDLGAELRQPAAGTGIAEEDEVIGIGQVRPVDVGRRRLDSLNGVELLAALGVRGESDAEGSYEAGKDILEGPVVAIVFEDGKDNRSQERTHEIREEQPDGDQQGGRGDGYLSRGQQVHGAQGIAVRQEDETAQDGRRAGENPADQIVEDLRDHAKGFFHRLVGFKENLGPAPAGLLSAQRQAPGIVLMCSGYTLLLSTSKP